ncbi:MAG: ATP-grasp domain-containing protein, partial [Acutalibacteraceae bacterium]|nr:ATP-grasp domain-containing protein [Acutalibacteraceae bacterium]
YAPYRILCDEWYREPVLDEEAYVRFCLDFCQVHGIDMFLPRRKLIAISRHKPEFEALGIKVMVDDYETVRLLNRKDLAYQTLAERGVSTIPPYEIVTDVGAFRSAYHALAEQYRAVCFKFVYDEGGRSYHRIDNTPHGYHALFSSRSACITFDEACAALSERETFAPLMVMPHLSGEEISADCLKTQDGTIILPRVKNATRVERMCFSDEIMQNTAEVLNAVDLNCPCNVQFKMLDGKMYFLEVNTRMSGGIQYACEAAGVNIPDIAVQKLLGRQKKWEICKEEKCVTYVETPLVF